jgi:hypothetical protein
MKIGILYKDFNLLRNWELRIINELINNSSYSISLIIQDGRKVGRIKRILQFLKAKSKFKKIIFLLQSIIENKVYPHKISVNKGIIEGHLIQIDTISLFPDRKEFREIFSEDDSGKIKTYDLDLILKLGFDLIGGEILNAAKHGIWSLHHADCDIIREGPVGFWEIVQNQPVIGATLYKLTEEPDGGAVIAKGFYNRHWSFIQSRNIVYENSVNLLFKNLNFLNTYNQIEYNQIEVCPNHANSVPGLKWFLKYLFLFYRKCLQKIAKGVLIKFGLRPEGWALLSSKGNILTSDLSGCEIIKPNKHHFWADPFTFKYKNVNHLFFENYSYKSQKGKITTGVLENNKISLVKDVLIRDYHLSYPFIIQENDDIFMIPESGQNMRLEIYRSTEFPIKWELYSTGFEGSSLVDTTIYTDSNNEVWLFTNKGTPPLNDFGSELYIYKIDSLKLNKIIPHKKNPVIIDCRYGRNAGPIYKDGDKIIRPSQNIINETYGYGINLSMIKKLTIDEYEEEHITTIKPDFKKGLIATHHLCQTEEGFVIDGSYKYL